MPDLFKYIVCFQTTNNVRGEKKTRVQFYQFWTHDAKEAKERAKLTCVMLTKKTNMTWFVEGVYVKCE